MKRGLGKIGDIWGTVERHVAAVFMIVMTAIYGFNVLVRFLAPAYASDFAWIDEAARYLMVWVVFLGIGVALEVGRHVSVDLVRGRLGAGRERVLFAVIDIVGLAYSLGAMVAAFELTVFVMRSGQFSPTLNIPAYFLYLAPVVGFASLAFRFLLRLLSIRDARRQSVETDWLGDAEA